MYPLEPFGSTMRLRGVSSAGRAPALQAGGHRFDPGTLHRLNQLVEGPLRRAVALDLCSRSETIVASALAQWKPRSSAAPLRLPRGPGRS